MRPGTLIRSATHADAASLREIYRPFVETTSVSFELEVPTVDEFAQRIMTSLQSWAWLVAEFDGTLVGYAYGGSHRARAAYRHSVETSAYVHAAYHRQGIARALYTRLLMELRDRDMANAYAGITLPNDASVAFHERLGFKHIGVFPRVGRKFGTWHDVAWFHRSLRESVEDGRASATHQ